MGAIERRIFELRLAVGDKQHVIYVKEEVDHLHEDRSIQVDCSKRISIDYNHFLRIIMLQLLMYEVSNFLKLEHKFSPNWT